MQLLSARWPRPPGRREISKWTKIWGILQGHALFAVGIWEQDILVAEIEELKKLNASETYPRGLNAKEVLITQEDGEFVFPVADGSAKLSGRDYEFQEPTLRRESTVKRENLSGESQGDREEFRREESEDDAEARKDWCVFKENFIYCHHIEPRVQLTCREKNHSSFHKIYILERTSSEKKYTMWWEDWRKAETSEAKPNSNVFDIEGKGPNSVLYYNSAQEFVSMKRYQESSSLNSIWKWKQAHVVSSRGTAYLWDKILQVTLKNWWIRDTLKCEPGKKKYELRMWFWSANFGNRELRMVQKTPEICLSWTHASGNLEVWIKIFYPKQCWFQMKRRQWERNARRS